MTKIDGKAKEEWAWDTYGMGMMEYSTFHTMIS